MLNSIKRVLKAMFDELRENIELFIVEAYDGMECLIALYLAAKANLRVNAIISDETMPFISGSYSSKIIERLIQNGKFIGLKMFISTALSPGNI